MQSIQHVRSAISKWDRQNPKTATTTTNKSLYVNLTIKLINKKKWCIKYYIRQHYYGLILNVFKNGKANNCRWKSALRAQIEILIVTDA